MSKSRASKNERDIEQRGGFLNPFEDMGSMFSNPFGMMKRSMDMFEDHFSQMNDMLNNGFSGMPEGTQCYVSSTVMTTLPNGVTESKRVIRTNDMESKEHFQQIGDRSRVAKYTKNLKSGEETLRKDAKNIRDEEMDAFKQEFTSLQNDFASQFGRGMNPFGLTNEHRGRSDKYLK